MTTTTDITLTTQVYQVFIKAAPEKIWDAITKPEFTSKYFYGTGISFGEVGGPVRYLHEDGVSTLVEGELLESDPPHKLVTTWHALYEDELATEPASRVTWEIAEHERGVSLLTVTHDRLEASPNTARSVSGTGWMLVLSGLKTLVETGSPLEG